MTIFFTADTHLGHANIIKYDNRPFASVEEMDDAIIRNWNRKVSPNDTVYHLGDVAFYPWNKPEVLKRYLSRLNGKIHLILGNHDRARDAQASGRFETIQDYHLFKGDKVKRIALFHYPMRSWFAKGTGTMHFFGHVHGSIPLMRGAVDVGVMCHDYAPISLEEAVVKAWEPRENLTRDELKAIRRDRKRAEGAA